MQAPKDAGLILPLNICGVCSQLLMTLWMRLSIFDSGLQSHSSHAILLLNLYGDFCNNTEQQHGELIILLSISEGILHNELSAVLQTAVRCHNPKGY